MIRATTPTFELKITDNSVDLTQASNVYATFNQLNRTLTKTGEALTIQARQVDVYFTQEESLGFTAGTIEIQLNWTYADGTRAATNIVKVYVTDNLLAEVLV